MKTTKSENAVFEAIMSRRSIRAYKPTQIKDTELDTIIQAAVNAPSALNMQPWEIRIIQNPKLLERINHGFINYANGKAMKGSASKSQEPDFSVFHNAPTVIIVANSTENEYSPVDCGLLGQNILLAAESMNIGTCVVGSVVAYFNTPEGEKEVLSKLNLPNGYRPIYTIAVGYKNQQPEAKPRDIDKVEIFK